MAWEVEFTDEFEEWWHTLSESEQGKVDARVGLLMERGPNLGFPFSSQVKTSRFPEMRELRAGMSAAAKAASAVEHRRLVEEMSLLELRKARELTQTKIADELHMGQGDVSKLERRTDMYVSTLAGYLQAVGADLEIRAVFPDGRAVKITQFSEESV